MPDPGNGLTVGPKAGNVLADYSDYLFKIRHRPFTSFRKFILSVDNDQSFHIEN
jgi:hypothetical protein